ncbi:MAG: FAD-dependent oxidoreductase, partial [Terriglobia bacterium]
KQVIVRHGAESFSLDYDKLVITTGGAPAQHLPGADRTGVFTCNNLGSARTLRTFLLARRPQRGVVIGGGYIGLEAAEALRAHNLQVTVLERSSGLLEDVEPDICHWVGERLTQHGVRIELNAEVTSIEPGLDGSLSVVAGPGREFPAQVVVLASGLVPRTEMAEQAGIQLGPSGAIRTDDRQQTNLPGVYAAGDCVETVHLVTGQPAYIPLGTTANKQGRVAGENAAGGHARFPGVVGTLITKLFELEVARTGLSYTSARAAGFQPELVTVTSRSRARYLGGKPLRVALIVDRPSGRLLGAQLVGEEGAARRVDVVATALTARMMLDDFVHLDLGYAPPFGPVYDPLLIAAWQALKQLGRRR